MIEETSVGTTSAGVSRSEELYQLCGWMCLITIYLLWTSCNVLVKLQFEKCCSEELPKCQKCFYPAGESLFQRTLNLEVE